jgi:hypothetical protein
MAGPVTRTGNRSTAPRPRHRCSSGAGEDGEYGAILSSPCADFAAGENDMNTGVQAPRLSGVDIRELNVALVYQPTLGHIPRCFGRSGEGKGGSLRKETASEEPTLYGKAGAAYVYGDTRRCFGRSGRENGGGRQKETASEEPTRYGSTRGEYPALNIVVGELHRRGILQFDRLLCEETDPEEPSKNRAYQRLGSQKQGRRTTGLPEMLMPMKTNWLGGSILHGKPYYHHIRLAQWLMLGNQLTRFQSHGLGRTDRYVTKGSISHQDPITMSDLRSGFDTRESAYHVF